MNLHGTSEANSIFFSRARSARSSTASSTVLRRSKSRISNSSFPASIFEKSRMSLMMVRSDSALEHMVCAKSRCSAFSSVSSSSPVMPITPFMGVRISWLMFARNSDFRRADSNAASRATTSSASLCIRSVISRKVTTAPISLLFSRIGVLVYSTGKLVPSFFQNNSSVTR